MIPQAQRAAVRLRLYRIRHELRHDQIAAAMRVGRASIYNYEVGHIVKLETIQAIADLMGLTFEQVIAPISTTEREEALQVRGRAGLLARQVS